MKLRTTAWTCIIASVGIHAAAINLTLDPDDTITAAAPPPAMVSAGNSFADMVFSASAPPIPTPVTPVETGLTLRPDEITHTTAQVQATATARLPDPIPAQKPEPEPAPEQDAEPAPTTRPQARPANLSPPRAVPQAAAPQNSQRGAAAPNAPTSQATQNGTGDAPDHAAITAARQAAASYPNQVMQRITHLRRDRTRARGIAVVAFNIGGDGRLTSVSLARSSGNNGLDQIAAEHIRRAAPFAPPPAGARTSFSFEFQGR